MCSIYNMHIIIENYMCIQTCKHDMRSQPERCISMQAKDRLRGLHLSPCGGARLLLRHAMESQGPAPRRWEEWWEHSGLNFEPMETVNPPEAQSNSSC